MSKNNLQQYLRGVHAALPVILGYIPVGIAYAIMAREAGISGLQTILMSLLVFAGASQMMAVGMFSQGASVIAMILATFILNLRHLIMSTCVTGKMEKGNLPLKLLATFGVTDESFAIFTTQKTEKSSVFFFLGLITGSYLSWVFSSAIGVVTSSFLPQIITASLGISLYAMFLGILVPNLKGNLKLAILVVFTAIVNTLLSEFMEKSWALIVSTLVCAFLGVFFISDESKKTKDEGEKTDE